MFHGYSFTHLWSQREVLIVQCEHGVDAAHTSLESGLAMEKIGLISFILHPHFTKLAEGALWVKLESHFL